MPDLSLERAVLGRGKSPVAGADEVGRGPLAGPVVAAAVILPPDLTGSEDWLSLLDDSKRLRPPQREEAARAVKEYAVDWAIASVEPQEIDRIGIGVASFRAMMLAVEDLRTRPAHLLLDYIHVRDCPLPYDTIVKGDSRSFSIAAASNLAKVERDRKMAEYDEIYPGYGFARHKGYATAFHRERLREIGPCALHRRSFAPVARAEMLFPDSA